MPTAPIKECIDMTVAYYLRENSNNDKDENLIRYMLNFFRSVSEATWDTLLCNHLKIVEFTNHCIVANRHRSTMKFGKEEAPELWDDVLTTLTFSF